MIVPLSDMDEAAVLALNQAHLAETSSMDQAKLRRMAAEAFYIRGIGRADAFLIAFDQDADYDSPNFLWFRAREARFVYIDRIIVAAGARGRGYGRALYEDLFDLARRGEYGWIACEINREPPNLVSDAFHAALGFNEVGSTASNDGKAVRYMMKGIQ